MPSVVAEEAAEVAYRELCSSTDEVLAKDKLACDQLQAEYERCLSAADMSWKRCSTCLKKAEAANASCAALAEATEKRRRVYQEVKDLREVEKQSEAEQVVTYRIHWQQSSITRVEKDTPQQQNEANLESLRSARETKESELDALDKAINDLNTVAPRHVFEALAKEEAAYAEDLQRAAAAKAKFLAGAASFRESLQVTQTRKRTALEDLSLARKRRTAADDRCLQSAQALRGAVPEEVNAVKAAVDSVDETIENLLAGQDAYRAEVLDNYGAKDEDEAMKVSRCLSRVWLEKRKAAFPRQE
jgi:hypothetical protein